MKLGHKMQAKTNHTLVRVSDDISRPACVIDEHRQSNRVLTCVTLKIKTFHPIKRCHVSWRKSLKAPLIRVQHMSPIEIHHVSLTHPQTPINRSLSKAFLHTKTSIAQVVQKRFRSTQKYRSSTGIKPQSLQELQP